QAVSRATDRMRAPGSLGLLYYAGHGVQVDWRNYMLPVEFRMTGGGDVAARAVDVSQVVDAFKRAGTRMNILVLDACRDNPFASGSAPKGLAPMDAPVGTLLAYSTQPGNVAEDGEAGSVNGPYAQFLQLELARPFARVEDVFKRVRLQVRKKTGGRQIPWESTSLEEDFVFNTGSERAAPVPATDLAQQRQQRFVMEKMEWDRVQTSREPAQLYEYLIKYPSGSVSELAQARLEKIDPAKTVAVADISGDVQPLEARRFRTGDSYRFVVSDLLTKLEIERPSFEVTSADADVARFNQGYTVTQAGAIMRTIGGATLDPYQQWIPAGPYQVGKKWFTRSMLTARGAAAQWVELTGRVVARETVTVPAGSFETYRMEMEQVAQDGSRLKITYWGQPDWGVAVKQVREVRDTRGALSGQVYEMVSRRRGPG
ncbi:MAG: caspase family protein, partial [Pseudomonadota bacterium]